MLFQMAASNCFWLLVVKLKAHIYVAQPSKILMSNRHLQKDAYSKYSQNLTHFQNPDRLHTVVS